MALVLKFKTQINVDADRLFITNLTGEYATPDNEGGFGTPNENLNELCLLAIIQRNASTGAESLEPIGNPFSYNPTAANDFENVFEFEYINDGWHTMDLIVLPVSVNQNTDLLGATINIGDNFYYTVTSKIHIKTGVDASEEVADLTTVLDQAGITKSRCEDMFLGTLSVERENQYISYRKTRSGVCQPDAKFNAMRELTEDIISADLTFRSGLTVQSQDQVEVLLDEQNV